MKMLNFEGKILKGNNIVNGKMVGKNVLVVLFLGVFMMGFAIAADVALENGKITAEEGIYSGGNIDITTDNDFINNYVYLGRFLGYSAAQFTQINSNALGILVGLVGNIIISSESGQTISFRIGNVEKGAFNVYGGLDLIEDLTMNDSKKFQQGTGNDVSTIFNGSDRTVNLEVGSGASNYWTSFASYDFDNEVLIHTNDTSAFAVKATTGGGSVEVFSVNTKLDLVNTVNLLPTTDDTDDIGNATFRYRDLVLSGNITMASPNGTSLNCQVNDTGSFLCN